MASARPRPSRDGPVRWLASLLVPHPRTRNARHPGLARRARTMAAAASPGLNPRRSRPNGRHPAGSMDFSALNPATTKSERISTPATTTASAQSPRISSAPSASAATPDVQASETQRTGPRQRKSRARCCASDSGSASRGIAPGGPARERRSMPAFVVESANPIRSGATLSNAAPACACASRMAAAASA